MAAIIASRDIRACSSFCFKGAGDWSVNCRRFVSSFVALPPANENDVAEFMTFMGLRDHAALRSVARSHVIAWRKDLESRKLSAACIGVSFQRCHPV
jgi:hypothetical protein